MADVEAQVSGGEAIAAAFQAQAHKLIRKACYSKTGQSTPYKIWQDVHRQDTSISLEIVRQWLRETMERPNSFVAPRAYRDWQADLFYVTDRHSPIKIIRSPYLCRCLL